MNWPLSHRELRVRKTRGRLLLPLVAVSAMLMALTVGGQPADANTTGATNPGCSEINTASFSPGCLPPLLLNLSGLYAATPTQTAGLLNLETDAIENTIEDHGLASTDENAVLSWGRDDVEAELFGLIVQAIDTPATSLDADQQDAVAWVQAVEQREAEAAAQDAALEYVKWAGLDQGTYSSLISLDADQSDLQSFLSGTPEPYNNSELSGYCSYQPPPPDQSEYTAPSSYCSGNGGIGTLLGGPPTPSYDEFTAWGEADADYALQDSIGTVQAGADIAAGLYFAAPFIGGAVGGASLSSGLASDLVGTAIWQAIAPYLSKSFYERDGEVAEEVAEELSEEVAEDVGDAAAETAAETAAEVSSAQLAGSLGFIAGAAIFAITTAVVQGIEIADAAALPGQLASLIVNARTTAPAQSTLLSGANGSSSLFNLFVGATLPMPTDQTCDNSSPIPPGLTVLSGTITEGNPDCLNPTAIPAPSSADPQFVVPEQGATMSSTTPSITWENASAQSTLTARLSWGRACLHGACHEQRRRRLHLSDQRHLLGTPDRVRRQR